MYVYLRGIAIIVNEKMDALYLEYIGDSKYSIIIILCVQDLISICICVKVPPYTAIFRNEN